MNSYGEAWSCRYALRK